MPGEGHPDRRPAGPGHPGALHRLRRVLQGLHAVGQARRVGRRGRARRCWRAPTAWRPSSRPASRPSSSTSTTRRWSARCAPSASTPCTRWRSARNSWRTSTGASSPATPSASGSPPPARRSSATSSATTPTSPRRSPRSSRPWSRRRALLRRDCGPDLKIVFVGPCIAKKRETAELAGEVDEALTFAELREMVASARHRSAVGRRLRVRSAPQPRRRAVPDQRRHAAGGGDPGGPGDRPRDGGRRPGRVRAGDQGSRVGADGHAPAGGAVLPRLHDGPRHEHRPAPLRPARPRQPVRPASHRQQRPGRVAGVDPLVFVGRTCRATTRRGTCGCPCRRPNSCSACWRNSGSPTRRTSSTAAPAAIRAAANWRARSIAAWPSARCACPTASSTCATRCASWAARTRNWPPRRWRWCRSEKLASMGQLAAGIAHEVNNPLGVVIDVLALPAGAAGRQAGVRHRPVDGRGAGGPLQEDRRRPARLRAAEQGRARHDRRPRAGAARPARPRPPARRGDRGRTRGHGPGARGGPGTRSRRCW